MTDCSFPRRLHVRSPLDFERVYAGGRGAVNDYLKVIVAPNGLDCSRLGLSVGARYGDAVTRNRFKRRVRESFRRNRVLLPVGFDMVVIPVRRVEPTQVQTDQSLVELVNKAANKVRSKTERDPR